MTTAQPVSNDVHVTSCYMDSLFSLGGVDYAFTNPSTIIVPAEVANVSFNIIVIDDHVLEANQSFLLYFSSSLPHNVAEGIISQVQVIIFNDDG